MSENRTEITRPNYGPRRAQSANSEFSLDQESLRHIPSDADVLLNFGAGRKRLHLQIGRGVDFNSDRPVLYGQTASRFTSTHYVASLYGAPSALLGQMTLLARPSPLGYEADTVWADGALYDTAPSGVMYIDALYPMNTGITGYSGIFTGTGDSYDDGANMQAGNGPNNTLMYHNSDVGPQGTVATRQFYNVSRAASIPYYTHGRDHLGRTVRALFVPTVAGVNTLATASLADVDTLMQRMIITPDEYLARNGQALRGFFRRIHNFSGDQLQYHMRKGFRGSFFDRVDQSFMRLIGELSHLGASIREGLPVRNCYESVYEAPQTGITDSFTITDGAGNDLCTIARTGTTSGHAFTAEATQTVANIDASFQEYWAEEVVGNTFNGHVVVDADINNIEGHSTVADVINPTVDGDIIGLTCMNASINPFFVYVDEIGNHAIQEHNGLFSCVPQLAEALSPGLFEIKDGESFERDYLYTDFKRGLEWVWNNCAADQASAWSTQMRWVRENFTDFKKGKMHDIYHTDARTDPDIIRHGWNLGVQELTTSSPMHGGYNTGVIDVLASTNVGIPTPRAIGGLDDLYENGFINNNNVELFIKGIDDLAKRDFHQGSDFGKGLQLVGDASYTTYHRTTSDGVEHHIDVTIQPMAFGHWANVPVMWENDDGLWNLRTAVTGPGDRAVEAGVFTGNNNEFSFHALMTQPIPITDIMSHEDSGANINIGALSFVFTQPMTFDLAGDDFNAYTGVRSLTWNDLTPALRMPIQEWPARSADEIAGNILFGNDPHGLVRQTADMNFMVAENAASTAGTLRYLFRDADTVQLSPVSLTSGWYDRTDRLVKDIMSAKSYAPFGSDGVSINTEAVNLVALASFSTGEPALQQMGDAIFTIAFCGQGSGWSIEQRSVDRQLENENMHVWTQQAGYDNLDYAGMIVPQEMDPSKLLTAFSAANIVCYNLGLIGAGMANRPNDSRSYHLDYAAVRTIYRSDAAHNGELLEKSITAWEQEFQYATEQPIDAGTGIVNQLQCQPGAHRYSRLFNNLDVAAPFGAFNSVCGLLGLDNIPNALGSIIDGLDGYSGLINDDVTNILHSQGTGAEVLAGLVSHMADGTTGENGYGYWTVTDGLNEPQTGHNIRLGDYINTDFVRVMVERHRGINNLYFKEANVRIMLFDQDLFDHFTAVRSCMIYEDRRGMIVGPCPHIVVYDSGGQVLLDAKEVEATIVGAGQSATASSGGSSAPAQPAPEAQADEPSSSDAADSEDTSS